MEINTPQNYRALRVQLDETGTKVAQRSVQTVPFETLPEHQVTVRVAYSSLNYKDALSATGNKGVSRVYPHTPGIDAAGTVVSSSDEHYKPGDKVIVTGYDLGMDTPGGYGEYIRVPGEWVVPLPDGLTLRQAMALGTAGFTAALCMERLAFAGATADLGPLVVTGASGGVGTWAVALAAAAGYEVIASTGKPDAEALLKRLGASQIVGREQLGNPTDRPLLKGLYAGGVDTVGGATLDNLIKSTVVGGAVAACGLVGGAALNLTVMPFILRGVALAGVSSQHAPRQTRLELWQQLADNALLGAALEDDELVAEVALDDLEPQIQRILVGKMLGRVVVRS